MTSFARHWDEFWFSSIPPAIYAVLRVALGVVGCLSLVGLLDLPLFWSCDGLVASREAALCAYFQSSGYPSLAGSAILAAALASFFAMAVGFRSRLSTLCAFVAVSMVGRWNDLPLSSAHQVLRALLFCLIWADSGAVLSVDAWMKRRSGRLAELRTASLWPLQLFRIQVAAVYLVTGLWKLGNVMWRDGSALHYVFENPQFRRFAWSASPSLDLATTAITYATLAWELAFAFLVFNRRTRRWTLAIGIALHAGMWAVLELGPFSWVMIVSYLSFLDPETVNRWLAVVSRRSTLSTTFVEA